MPTASNGNAAPARAESAERSANRSASQLFGEIPAVSSHELHFKIPSADVLFCYFRSSIFHSCRRRPMAYRTHSGSPLYPDVIHAWSRLPVTYTNPSID